MIGRSRGGAGEKYNDVYGVLSSQYVLNHAWWRKMKVFVVLAKPLLVALRLADNGAPNLAQLCHAYEVDVLPPLMQMVQAQFVEDPTEPDEWDIADDQASRAHFDEV